MNGHKVGVNGAQGQEGLGGIVSLSEQEQRVLREIEQSLLAEDPRFGAAVSGGSDFRSASPGLLLRGVALGVLGLVLLVGGVALAQNSLWFIVLSVAGFLLMFGAGVWVLRGSSSGEAGLSRRGASGPNETRDRQSRGGGSSVAQRMEEDFRRRFE
ncbi:hypothetical protein Clow_00975 [Corynebacterium lowii]|uniref:DUF3040 domain-containing protein n=1 Tax=Corynebacterium lowii TaxID=1544413 RepID=A0A0Q1AJ19_9CORY|nr:hypothetical protein Clow_00975 [Corynebacterium lowii]MDP9851453.1 hypothetical protein [Corynebacterium lowii]